jgi:putative transposase
MPRTARLVIPGIPHHVIQRGNRKQKVFFSDKDRNFYLNILKEKSKEHKLELWAYCLMDNHVHFVAVPEKEESLAKAFGETHKKYTKTINERKGWVGYLWQGRFRSYPMDKQYLYSVVRYVENNPVRAGIVEKAEDYKWSSAYSHVNGLKDILCTDNFFTQNIDNWKSYLSLSEHFSDDKEKTIKKHSETGWPLGDDDFIKELEKRSGRRLRKSPKGRKKEN